MNNTGPVAVQSGRVAIAGDWHGSISWAQSVIPRIHREAPDVDTIFHVGDFGLYPEAHGKGFLAAVDFWCKAANIRRVYVCPGNHEHWGELTKRFEAQPGQAVQLSSVVWVFPRGYRFTVDGKEWMSFGGAASLDREFRTPDVTWWPEEAPTDADVNHAIAGGPVAVLLTHEAINGGTREVECILAGNPLGWPWEAMAYSLESRERVTRVWKAVQPEVLAHGHLHTKGEITLPTGQRVYSLACNGQPGNIGLMETESLEWKWLTEEQ